MKINVFEQYGKFGRKAVNPVAYKNVDLYLKEGEATIFSELGKGPMLSTPIMLQKIEISGNGLLIRGLQETSNQAWTRQEWWCVPIKEN